MFVFLFIHVFFLSGWWFSINIPRVYMCRDAMKGTLCRENEIEFYISCSRGYSAGHFGMKIMYLAQFLTVLLRILSFKTCLMKN